MTQPTRRSFLARLTGTLAGVWAGKSLVAQVPEPARALDSSPAPYRTTIVEGRLPPFGKLEWYDADAYVPHWRVMELNPSEVTLQSSEDRIVWSSEMPPVRCDTRLVSWRTAYYTGNRLVAITVHRHGAADPVPITLRLVHGPKGVSLVDAGEGWTLTFM